MMNTTKSEHVHDLHCEQTCTPKHKCGEHATDHVHSQGCGHQAVIHEDHVDYVVDGHLHHQHGDHCDNHGVVA